MLSALDLLQPGEEALVLNASHDFEHWPDGPGEVSDYLIKAARVGRVDCIIVFFVESTGVTEPWRGKLVKWVAAVDGKKRLSLTELRLVGPTELGWIAFVGGPGDRNIRYVRRS